MTNAEADRTRACLSCGKPNAWCCRTTKGANPGRSLRLCLECLRAGGWYEYGLVDRAPLPSEHTDETD